MDINRGGVAAVGSKLDIIEATFTRPADTTTYAAGDIIANATAAASLITFSGAGRLNGGTGAITDAILIVSTAPATKLDAELYIFGSAPATDDDNEALALSDSDVLKCLGVIDFGGSPYVTGPNVMYQALGVNLGFECASDSQALYGILVARNAYVPGNADVFTFRLKVAQD